MKVSSSREEGFKPIELKITIESINELLELWWRINLSWTDIKRMAADDPSKIKIPSGRSWDLSFFRELNKYIRPAKYE